MMTMDSHRPQRKPPMSRTSRFVVALICGMTVALSTGSGFTASAGSGVEFPPPPPLGLDEVPVPEDNPMTPAQVDLGRRLFHGEGSVLATDLSLDDGCCLRHRGSIRQLATVAMVRSRRDVAVGGGIGVPRCLLLESIGAYQRRLARDDSGPGVDGCAIDSTAASSTC